MRYQIIETPIFLGIFDSKKCSRSNVELMGFMPYWIIAMQTWDEVQYRQVYELCEALNRLDRNYETLQRFKFCRVAAQNHFTKAMEALTNDNPTLS